MPERGRDVTDAVGSAVRASSVDARPCYGRDSERKVRREIANSNERRRMQSINAGFQSLRKLLQARDKDKLSKASVLQKAVEYIYSLENERSYLRTCNTRLMRRLQSTLGHEILDEDDMKDFSSVDSMKNCSRMDTESSDEGTVCSPSPNGSDAEDVGGDVVMTLRRQVFELQRQLEQERRSDSMVADESSIVTTNTTSSTRRRSGSGDGVGLSRRGSLETIVEAIRCLEGDANGSTGCCLANAASNGSLVKDEYVIAAAEALQFIAARRQSSSSTSALWQCQKSTLAVDSWRSCL